MTPFVEYWSLVRWKSCLPSRLPLPLEILPQLICRNSKVLFITQKFINECAASQPASLICLPMVMDWMLFVFIYAAAAAFCGQSESKTILEDTLHTRHARRHAAPSVATGQDVDKKWSTARADFMNVMWSCSSARTYVAQGIGVLLLLLGKQLPGAATGMNKINLKLAHVVLFCKSNCSFCRSKSLKMFEQVAFDGWCCPFNL